MATRSSCPPNAAAAPDRYRDYAGCGYSAVGGLVCAAGTPAPAPEPNHSTSTKGGVQEHFADAPAATPGTTAVTAKPSSRPSPTILRAALRNTASSADSITAAMPS
jgi:hypothetical protein